jgi:hypothetical protein
VALKEYQKSKITSCRWKVVKGSDLLKTEHNPSECKESPKSQFGDWQLGDPMRRVRCHRKWSKY